MGQYMSSIKTEETADSLGLIIFSQGPTSVDMGKLSTLGRKIYTEFMCNSERIRSEGERMSVEIEKKSHCDFDPVGVMNFTDEEQVIVWKLYYEQYIRPLEVSTGLHIRIEWGKENIVRQVKNEEGLVKEFVLTLVKPE